MVHVSGEIEVPGDKSLSHRALMLAAVAAGESRLRGVLPGEDCRSTASVLRALGCRVPELPRDGGELRIESGGLAAWQPPGAPLDCGNSGTTARLMMGLLAARPFAATVTGDASLRGRPMRRVTEPLAQMGATVRELGQPDRLPIEIHGGPLRALRYHSPRASAQVKSALLLAGLSGGVRVAVREPSLSRDHTERMLAALGVDVTVDGERGAFVEVRPTGEPLPPLDFHVPGDPSSAAFLCALAMLADGGELSVRRVGLNPTRTAFLDVLREMGGRVETTVTETAAGEPVGDIRVGPGPLEAIEVRGARIPAMIDELPLIAVLGARANGETRVRDAAELRAKESDRVTAVVENLRAIGADAEELPDGFVVRGSDRPLAGRVRVHHDHRIAMAFGVLAADPKNDIEIDDPAVVAVSYPGFWQALGEITRPARRG